MIKIDTNGKKWNVIEKRMKHKGNNYPCDDCFFNFHKAGGCFLGAVERRECYTTSETFYVVSPIHILLKELKKK